MVAYKFILDYSAKMKAVLPLHVSVEVGSEERMKEITDEFHNLLLVAAEANCRQRGGVEVSAEDLIMALREFGLERHSDMMASYLEKYLSSLTNKIPKKS